MISRGGAFRRLSAAAARSREHFTPVIGLEVHVQLATKTKLFSRASINEDAPPNSQVAAFDMAEPGTLPRLNRAAVMHALKMAVLMNCDVPGSCHFDRKHYFYADMPAGYQITQSRRPIAKTGHFGYHVYSEEVAPYWKTAEIIQLQLEQDSGKTIHVGNTSLVDLNRAGVPLVEVVTTPCFSTALEALCFVQQLRLILMHYGICDGELHKGHLRVDANVSVSQGDVLGIRTEIKNMNSLRHLHTAVNYEIDRQYGILSQGGIILNETRACDQQGRTVSMRDKEEETDYRMLPEPNLPTLQIRSSWLEDSRREISSSQPTFQNFIEIGFDPRTAIHYAEDPLLCRFVENCSSFFEGVSIDGFNAWLKELKQIMQRSKAVYPPQSEFFGEEFMTVVGCLEGERITKLRAIETLRNYVNNGEKRRAQEIFESNNLWRIREESAIAPFVSDVFQKNAKIAEKARGQNSKAISRLRTLVIEASGKRIDVEDADRSVRLMLGDK